MFRLPGIVLLALSLSSCDLLDSFKEPTITDTSERWMNGDARILTAEITVPNGYQIVDVYARYTRHHWPGAPAAHEVVAQPVTPDGNSYRAVPMLAQTAIKADHLFYEWFIDYRLPEGNEVATVRSGRRDFVVGCSDNSIRANIDTLAIFLAPFADAESGFDLLGSGFLAVPHKNASLAGVGVTFAGAGNIFNAGSVEMGPPGLLFFAPRDQRSDETDAQYQALIEDPDGDTTPYRLIGAAWGKVMDSPTRRPSMGCIPSSEWFLHEAGYHLNSGVMALRSPQENVPGETLVDGLFPVPGLEAPTPDNVLMWHPRVWDLHLWLPQDDGDRASLSIYAPFDVPGAVACEDIDEPDCSAMVFFYPETFE